MSSPVEIGTPKINRLDLNAMTFSYPKATTNNEAYIAVTPSGMRINPNYLFLSNNQQTSKDAKFFLIADSDRFIHIEILRCKNNPRKREKVIEKYTSSHAEFLTNRPSPIVIRELPSSHPMSDLENRVFVADLLNIIIPAMNAQGIDIKKDKSLEQALAKLKKSKTRGVEPYVNPTIPVSELEEVLNTFKIPLNSIYLIGDKNDMYGRILLTRKCCMPITIVAPSGRSCMDYAQAVTYLFYGVVCGFNWVNGKCEKHENCRKAIKPRIMKTLKEYAKLENCYIDEKHVGMSMVKLKAACPKLNIDETKQKLQYFFLDQDFKSAIPQKTVTYFVEKYSLKSFEEFVPNLKTETLPVWMVRLFLCVGWLESFFDSGDVEKLIIAETFILSVPEEEQQMAKKLFLGPLLERIKEENKQAM